MSKNGGETKDVNTHHFDEKVMAMDSISDEIEEVCQQAVPQSL